MFIAQKTAGWLQSGDFDIDGTVQLQKIGARTEVETSQRDALLALYGLTLPTPKTLLHIASDGDKIPRYDEWATANQIGLRKLADEAIIGDDQPPISDNIKEVPTADDKTARAAITSIRDILAPEAMCGKMIPHQLKLLTVFAWPEFRIRWRPVRIKIGCATVTISVPAIDVRSAKLVLYAYFLTPESLFGTLVKRAESCAGLAAVEGAVLGVITGNFAAAVGAFETFFVNCMKDIGSCFNPGLLLLKEAPAWPA